MQHQPLIVLLALIGLTASSFGAGYYVSELKALKKKREFEQQIKRNLKAGKTVRVYEGKKYIGKIMYFKSNLESED